MNKKSYIPFIVIVSVLVGLFIGYYLVMKRIDYNNVMFSSGGKMDDVLNLITSEYVDEVDRDSLIDNAVKSMITTLDPHSTYLTRKEVKSELESLEGGFDGIGIQFRLAGDSILVVRTLDNGPSQKVGILAGDRIVKVNGRKLIKPTNDTVLHLLKGKKNSKVDLTVYRKGINKLLNFSVKRDKIKTKAVPYYGMLNSHTGYIKLNEFTATSHDEVYEALSKLNRLGMKDLIFDIRDNGGGYLDQATDIADEFIESGDLIVYTNGRLHGRNNFFAKGGGLFEKGKLVVMINELSASASEIVSGAIQDNDRGTIVGRRTFGKGLVQEQKNLNDGSAIRLTVARYYTPSGRCIQRPYIKGDPDKYFEDFIKRFEMGSKDTIKHDASLKYKTKKGRYVYGGGGIEPDKVIPYSVMEHSNYFNSLFKNGIIFKYCFDYVDAHRKEFAKYKNGDEFIKGYEVSNTMYKDFLFNAKSQGANTRGLTAKESQEIKSLMKGYIAQNLYDEKYFYSIYTKLDPELNYLLHY